LRACAVGRARRHRRRDPRASCLSVHRDRLPGAVGSTQAFGINNSGQIAGDTLGGIAFVYDIKKNTYTVQPSAPDSATTTAIGINNPEVTVGGATDTSGVERGAIFDKGCYTLFANPGWVSTEARGISNNGMVTGYSVDITGGNLIGFLYDPKNKTFGSIARHGTCPERRRRVLAYCR
jgi:hypothetical protein